MSFEQQLSTWNLKILWMQFKRGILRNGLMYEYFILGTLIKWIEVLIVIGDNTDYIIKYALIDWLIDWMIDWLIG